MRFGFALAVVAAVGSVDRADSLQAQAFGAVSENLFVCDGIVLEIFGLTQVSGASLLDQRFHRDLMTITIEEPDRKGVRNVEINAGGSGCQFRFGAEDQPVVEFLERVRAALPAA